MSDIFSHLGNNYTQIREQQAQDYKENLSRIGGNNDYAAMRDEQFAAGVQELRDRNERAQKLREKYGFDFSIDQYAALGNALDKGVIGEDQAYDILAAQVISDNLKRQGIDINPQAVLENLPAYNEYILGRQGGQSARTPKGNLAAIHNEFIVGAANMRKNFLYMQLADAKSNNNAELENIIRQRLGNENKIVEQYSDYQKRNFFVEAAKFAASSSMYTTFVIAGGMLGGIPGAFAAGWAGATGQSYGGLIEAGVDHKIAYPLSIAMGAVNAAIESQLGNAAGLVGRAAGAQTLQQSIAKRAAAYVSDKLHLSGAALKMATGPVARYVLESAGEMSEEVFQEIADIVGTELAAFLQKEGVQLDRDKYISRIAQSAKAGFMASLFMGVPGLAIDTAGSIGDYRTLRTDADTIPSEAIFKERHKNSSLRGDMNDEEWGKELSKIHEGRQSIRDREEARAAEELRATSGSGAGYAERQTNEKTGEDELINPETGKQIPLGEVYYNKAGLFHTEIDMKRGIFKIGDPRVAGEYNLYADFNFKVDENGTVHITSIHIREDLNTPEFLYKAYDQFAESFAGQEIVWDAKTVREAEIREALIKNNPRGETAGLNYYYEADTQNISGARYRNRVIDNFKRYFPQMGNTEHSVMAAEWEHFANMQGQSLEEYVNNEFGSLDKAFTTTPNVRIDAAAKEGGKIKGAVTFESLARDARAAIYLGKNADLTTFIHEMGHIYRRRLQGDMLAQAEKLWGVKNGKWTTEQEEQFTEDLERWRRDGEAPTPEMKSFFEKFAQFLKDIINAISRREKVSPEIKEFFDSLYSGEALQGARMAQEGAQETKTQKDTASETEGRQEGAGASSKDEDNLSKKTTTDKKKSVNKKTGENSEENKRRAEISRKKWEGAERIIGAEDQITLQTGEVIEGHYELGEAGISTPSVDPDADFTQSEGFPVNENGTSMNVGRDYTQGFSWEAAVRMASDFDQRGLGIIVDSNGVTSSGNNRDISRRIAAKNGTDSKYIHYLKSRPERWGFTQEDINKFKHPTVYFVVDAPLFYTPLYFDLFNRSGEKSVSPLETAIKMSYLLNSNSDMVNEFSAAMGNYDSINELYEDTQAATDIFRSLMKKGIVTENSYPDYVETITIKGKQQERITSGGKEFLESVMLGAVLNEDSIRSLAMVPDVRRRVVKGLAALVDNAALGEYSVIEEINQSVGIAVEVQTNKKKYKSIEDYAGQNEMELGQRISTDIEAELAGRLLEKTEYAFSDMMGGLNAVLREEALGQSDMFGGTSKDDILRRYLGIKARVNEIRAANTKIIESEKAATLEKVAAAMENAGLARDEAGGTFFQPAYHGSPHLDDSEINITQTFFQTEELTGEEKETAEAAKAKYGITTNIKEGGYLLIDGSILDFSEKKEGGPPGHRTLDHREMDYFEYDGKVYQPGKWNFIARGNIRLMPEIGGITIALLPSAAQAIALKRYIQYFNGEIIIDFTDGDSNEINSIEYNSGTKAARILNDIKNYYENGIIPEQQDILFQLDESEKSDIITDEELEEIGLAYGSREKYREALRNAAGRLLRRGKNAGNRRVHPQLQKQGASFLADSELKNLKRINIVGKQINSRDEAAALFSLFRDPRVEIFNILYTSETGEVLAHQAWTSGIPHIVGNDGSIEETVSRIKETMAGLNAVNIWIAHNHPSGDVRVSNGDIGVSKKYFDNLKEAFAGHVVLDHDKYTFIKPDGSVVKEISLKQPAKNFLSDDLTRSIKVISPHVIANSFKGVLDQKNNSALAVLDRRNRIASWNYIDDDIEIEAIYNYMRIAGGSSVVIVTNNINAFEYYDNVSKYMQRTPLDVFLDIVKVNKDGEYSIGSDYHAAHWAEYANINTPSIYHLIDNKSDQPVLFQLYDEMIEDAAQYDTWKDFRDSMEPREASNADNAWYRSLWNDAQKIYNTTLFQDEEKKSRAELLDKRFYDEADKKYLTEALKELYRIHNDQTLEPTQEESDDAHGEYRRIKRLQHRINTELPNAGSIIGMAAQVRSGRALSSVQYNRIKDLIRKNKRDYRAIFADIMKQEEFLEELAEKKEGEPAGRLADPRPDKQNIKARLKEIADIMREADPVLAKEIEDGTVSYNDPRIIAFETGVEAEYREAKAAYEALEKETAEDYARLANDMQRRIVAAHERMVAAREKMDKTDEKLQRMMEEEGKIAEPYIKQQRIERADYDQAFRIYNDLLKSHEKDVEIEKAVARREAKAKEKARQEKLNKKRRAAKALRELKLAHLKRITRRVKFENVAYKQAEIIKTVQRIFLPSIIETGDRFVGTIEGPLLRQVWGYWQTDEKFRENILNSVKNDKKKIKLTDLLEKSWDFLSRKEKQEIIKLLPKTTVADALDLYKLSAEYKEDAQLDIEERVVNGQAYLVLGVELEKRVKEAVGEELYRRIQNKPLAEWTPQELEELARTVDELTVKGRRDLAIKREARRNIERHYRALVLDMIQKGGIEINDDDTPEEKEHKTKELAKIAKQGTRYSSGKRRNNLANNFFDANLRRFTTAMDNGRKGVFTDLLYWAENDAYNQEQTRIAARRLLVETVMKKQGITLDELYKAVEIPHLEATSLFAESNKKLEQVATKLGLPETTWNMDGFFEKRPKPDLEGTDIYRVSGGKITIDDILYIMRGVKNDETRKAIIYGNLSNARERTHYKGLATKLDEIAAYENIGYYRLMKILSFANDFFAKAENKKFLALAEAIGEDYDSNGKRLNEACIEMFDRPIWRVNNYVPMNRREQSAGENENRVIEDLLGVEGAGQKWVQSGFKEKRDQILPYHQAPIEMGLYKTWAQSVTDTEHLLAYGPLVKKLNAVFKGWDTAEIRQALNDRFGRAAVKRVDDTIAEFANPNPTRQRSALDKLVRELRGKTATAYLAWKTSSILKQLITSPWPYMQEIPPPQYIAACMEVAAGAGKINDFIREKSIFMKNRDFDPMVKLIKEARDKNDNAILSHLDKFNNVGMKGLEWADWICVAPGWLAVYRKELANIAKEQDTEYQKLLQKYQGNEYADVLPTPESKANRALSEIMGEEQQDIEAVARADDAVRRMQPSSRITDLSPLFKGKGEIGNLLLQFQSALNVIWQNIRYDLPLAVKEKQVWTVLGMVTGYALAGIGVGLLTEGAGGDDEEGDAARQILFYSITQFTDAVPIIGDAVTLFFENAITGKKSYSGQKNILPVAEKALGGLNSLVTGVREDDSEKQKKRYIRTAQNMAEAFGLYFGAPVSGAKELGRTAGIGDGDGEFDLYLQALMGRRTK